MSNAKKQSSADPYGALKLHPRLWGRVFEYIEDGLDDLARVKAAVNLVICSKTLKTRLEAGGAELWDPLVESVAAVAPCVRFASKKQLVQYAARYSKLVAKPWLPLATLNSTCVHCRRSQLDVHMQADVHPTYRVRICLRGAERLVIHCLFPNMSSIHHEHTHERAMWCVCGCLVTAVRNQNTRTFFLRTDGCT